MQFIRSIVRRLPAKTEMEDQASVVPEEESVTIHFYWGIKPMKLSTSTELTCERALELCMNYIKNQVCTDQNQIHVAKYLPTFGLVGCPEEKIWLPLNHVFKKNSENPRIYRFRVRFRPPVEQFNDSIMCEYLFIQTLHDFLKGPIGKYKDLESKTLFALLQIALMIPKSLPLKNTELVDEKFRTRSLHFWNFTRCFSKEIASKLITQYVVDHFWVYKAIQGHICKCKSHDPPAPLGFYKKAFYKMLMEAVSGYRFEDYKAVSLTGKEPEEVLAHICMENNKADVLYYGEARECSIKDIYSMKLEKPKAMDNKKWLVFLYLWNDNIKILQFTEAGEAESFMSMIQGYFSLYVFYNKCLCKDLQTASSEISTRLKGFGPLEYHTAESYLEHSIQGQNTGGFLIHDSLSHIGQYEVVGKSKSECSQSQAGNTRNSRKSGTVICLQGSPMQNLTLRLKIDDKERIFENCDDLRIHLTEVFGPQVYTKNIPRVAEINNEFLSDIEYYCSEITLKTEEQTSMSLPVLREDLVDGKIIPDFNPYIKKREVYFKTKPMMLVELQSERVELSKSFIEGLGKLYRLHRVRPQNFVQFYSMILDSKMSVLMEYAPHMDLLTYLCGNSLKVIQKVSIMDQIVRTLNLMDKAKIYHGNIRARRFMVFDGQEPEYVTIKLGDPGISSYLDTLALDKHENIERIPWLAPERRENLKKITLESEVYAVGTTLCEILYRNDQFKEELKLGENESMLTYLTANKHLPKPPFIGDIRIEPSSGDPAHEGATSNLPNQRATSDPTDEGATSNPTDGRAASDLTDEGATHNPTDEGATSNPTDEGDASNPTDEGDTSNLPDEGITLLPEAENVFEKIWAVILQCWTINEADRPSVEALLTSMIEIKDLAQSIPTETVSDQLKEVLYKQDPGTDLHRMTRNQVMEKLENLCGHFNLPESRIDMNGYKDRLGEGYFGSVWEGRVRGPRKTLPQQDGSLKEKPLRKPENEIWTKVAVKRLKMKKEMDHKLINQEASVSYDFDHPNVVKVLHLCYSASNPPNEQVTYHPLMIIMEFMTLGNLSKYAKEKGDLTTPEQISHMLKICLDVAEGMAYLAGEGIVHRDLAARNILLTDDRNKGVAAKVSDFGLARMMDENQQFYRMKSEVEILPLCWPPECLVLMEGPCDKFSSQGDVWSFGTMMWEGFSKGQNPFRTLLELKNISQAKLLEKYKNSWRLPSRMIKQSVYNIMAMCWNIEPQKRPEFKELVMVLKNLIQDVQVEMVPCGNMVCGLEVANVGL